MPTVHIALGSNLGDRRANLDTAVRRLRAQPGIRVLAVSSYYETDPHGTEYQGQPPFLNAAAVLSTDYAPLALLRRLLEIEHDLGRVRGTPKAPRTVDLDLLLYGTLITDDPEMTLPHPRMHERAFVLVPLSEIADDALHPAMKQTVQELLEKLPHENVRLVIRRQPLRRRDLSGCQALITGSTGGIGRAIAIAFSDAGAAVIIHGRNADAAAEVVKELEPQDVPTRTLLADLRDPAAVDRLATDAWQAFDSPGLDILVCNAGADTLTGAMAKASFDEKLDELLAIDLKSTMRLSRAIGAKMKARGRGVILTIGWDQAETGMEGDSGELFSAVKGAIICFSRSLSISLAPEVRVNCLAPGWIRTAWGETASDVWQDRVRKETPQGVWGLPEDVAAAAVWLAGPHASYITGQTIRVNGGAVRK